jgi:hypothetical protein
MKIPEREANLENSNTIIIRKMLNSVPGALVKEPK